MRKDKSMEYIIEINNLDITGNYGIYSDNYNIFEKYIIVESDSLDISKLNTYSLKEGKLVLNEDKVKKNLEEKKEILLSKIVLNLSNLKKEYSEKEFLFKGKYLQRNKQLEDIVPINGLITLMNNTKTTSSKWKFRDKDTYEWIWVDLTLDDLISLGVTSINNVTKAMTIETNLLEKVKKLTVEELEEFDSRKEYEILWN